MGFDIHPEELQKVLWCPAIEDIFRETGSRIILESDEVSAQVKIVKGDLTWFRYKLRDRRFDGPEWKTTPLTDWTYGGQDDKFTLGSAVEESVYCLDPRYPLTNEFSESQSAFTKNPFEALPFENPAKENLAAWLRRWQEIFSKKKPPFPGYFAIQNIPGARKHIHESVAPFLKQRGYDYLTAVPTWWHTARICGHLGFSYQYDCDRIIMEKLNLILPSETDVFRRKSSWVVMLQFWAEVAEKAGFAAEDFVEKRFILRDESGKIMTFPLSPERNLWMLCKL